jgi:hypothetical protein
MARFEDYMTIAEAAEMRGITRQAVWLLVKRDRVRHLRFGNALFVHRKDMESYDPHPGGRPAKKRPRKSQKAFKTQGSKK